MDTHGLLRHFTYIARLDGGGVWAQELYLGLPFVDYACESNWQIIRSASLLPVPVSFLAGYSILFF